MPEDGAKEGGHLAAWMRRLGREVYHLKSGNSSRHIGSWFKAGMLACGPLFVALAVFRSTLAY